MKKYEILLTKVACRQLAKLSGKLANRILDKLEFFQRSKNPLLYAKKLKDRTLGEYSFRIGDYRVLFDLDERGELVILAVVSIKHRREVYKNRGSN